MCFDFFSKSRTANISHNHRLIDASDNAFFNPESPRHEPYTQVARWLAVISALAINWSIEPVNIIEIPTG